MNVSSAGRETRILGAVLVHIEILTYSWSNQRPKRVPMLHTHGERSNWAFSGSVHQPEQNRNDIHLIAWTIIHYDVDDDGLTHSKEHIKLDDCRFPRVPEQRSSPGIRLKVSKLDEFRFSSDTLTRANAWQPVSAVNTPRCSSRISHRVVLVSLGFSWKTLGFGRH